LENSRRKVEVNSDLALKRGALGSSGFIAFIPVKDQSAFCRAGKFHKEVKEMAVSLKPMTKASDMLKGMLNDATAREIAVSIQYMWQHVQVIGVKGIAVQDQFKKTAIAEMKHAEKIAERLWYLTGTPTVKPTPIKVGESLREFLELDTKAEEDAILLYKKIIEQAQKEEDVTTAFMFKEILEDEEEHHDLFTTMLEEV
jgi:bacterioferritin